MFLAAVEKHPQCVQNQPGSCGHTCTIARSTFGLWLKPPKVAYGCVARFNRLGYSSEEEKSQQAPGGFLSLSVFLPFNMLGYTVYVWQQMKRCMFACWATKHQHGKPKCTSTYWRAAQLFLQKSTTICTATLTAVCKDAIELKIILFQTLLSVSSVKHMIL